jgi:hypothetical protein
MVPWDLEELLRACKAASQVNDRQAIICADPTEHAVDMVLYGLFRNIQVSCDFFVGEPPFNERHKLLLPSGQAQFDFYSHTRE